MGLQEVYMCPACGKGLMVERRYGHVAFLGCSCYPSCKLRIYVPRMNTVSTLKILKSVCPECGKQLAVKKGRYGIFIGCSNYPECEYTYKESNSVELEEAIPCPICHQGNLEARRSRGGRVFYGCSHYPKCDYLLPGKPVMDACPTCAFPLRYYKKTKAGQALICGNSLCDSRRRRSRKKPPVVTAPVVSVNTIAAS